MEKNACGIVSYAGLSREDLLSLAKAAFAQAQPPAPKRFDAFLPLFPIELVINMDYIGVTDARNAKVAPSGFSIDPAEYHRKLYAFLPELYVQDNYSRNFDYEGRFIGRGVFAVDAAWADRFPQYQPFMGEKLSIYLLGGGFQAVAVPESVYPRSGGVLAAQERQMQVTQRADLFVQYVKARVAAGERYDADTFSADYLRAAKTTPLSFTQQEIGRALQNLSIMKSLQSEAVSVGLYTDNARMAERVFQYMPMRYACDLFAQEAVDKHTARLVQPFDTEADFVSDLWIPWQDFTAYVDRTASTVNMRALCEGYQIAPRYAPDAFGGRYPDAVRIATVRDRTLKLWVGEVINNPAYGDGMAPQGMIGKQAYIPDSREMLRQRKLTLEEHSITAENLTLMPQEYRRCLTLAALQEHKGRLIDAMYRRETVLAQMEADTPAYRKARELLNDRVEKLSEIVRRETKQSGMSQMSGYDADIDYLRRMQRNREGEPEQTVTGKPIAFARDTLREQSIESGYAMRANLKRLPYAQAALPEPPAALTLGADDSEDEPDCEPIPASAAKPTSAKHTAVEVAIVLPEPDDLPEELADAPSVKPAASDAPPSGQPLEPTAKSVANSIAVDAAKLKETNRDSAAEPEDTDVQPVSPVMGGLPKSTASGKEPEPKHSADAPEHDEPETNAPESTEPEPDVPPTAAPNAGLPPMQPADPSAPANPDKPQATDMPAESESNPGNDVPREAQPARRVSLRDLTDRTGNHPEPPAPEPETSAETETPKPKLAYILRRGSEGAATQSYNRMTDVLNKRGK